MMKKQRTDRKEEQEKGIGKNGLREKKNGMKKSGGGMNRHHRRRGDRGKEGS